MSEEERKEEQVVPEVEAARKELERHSKRLLETRADPEHWDLSVRGDARWVRTWSEVVLSGDVPEAFWQRVLDVFEYWQGAAKRKIEGRRILGAIRDTRLVLENLVYFAGLLGLEVPPEEKPEEEEAAAEVVVEEPAVKEGTPLVGLELSVRVYNLLVWHFQPLLGRGPLVEDIVEVLEDEAKGEEYLLNRVKFFGPVALAELKEKLREKGFLPEVHGEQSGGG